MYYTIRRQFPRWSFRWPSGQKTILSGITTISGIGAPAGGISVVSWHSPSRIILITNIILNRTRSFIFKRYRKAWKTFKDRNSSILSYSLIVFFNCFKFSLVFKYFLYAKFCSSNVVFYFSEFFFDFDYSVLAYKRTLQSIHSGGYHLYSSGYINVVEKIT